MIEATIEQYYEKQDKNGMLLFLEVMVTRMNWHLRKSMASCLLKRCKWWYNRSVVAFINWKIYGSFMKIRGYKNESY